jgi:hypothetical protein
MDLSGTLGMSYDYLFKVMVDTMKLSVRLTDFYYSQNNEVGVFKANFTLSRWKFLQVTMSLRLYDSKVLET